MQCLAVRAERCEAPEVLAARGALKPLVHQGQGRFLVTAEDVEIDASDFERWLIVRDSPEGLRAQARFNDWAHRARSWGGGPTSEVGVGRVSVVDQNPLGFAQALRIDWIHSHDPPLEDDARVLLMPSFLDFNTDKVLRGLERLDCDGGLFVDLLSDPASAAAQPRTGGIALNGNGSTFNLTPSQSEAWRTVAGSRVTAVWGPPGTGKTHFLAAIILGLGAAHPGRRGHGCRVLISAMTHAAINNLLRKIVSLAKELDQPIPVMGKVGGMEMDEDGSVEAIKQTEIDGWLQAHRTVVLGSTVWGLAKSVGRFDVVVIDEASQMKVPDAALAIERVRDGGRLVAAGDHHQLGPILAGAYPDPPDGEPTLHGSAFNLLRDGCSRSGVPVCQLLENWRMCDVLTEAARPLYGPGYRCATVEVASRRLRLRRRRSSFVGTCMAPDAPLVVVTLEGVEATNVNRVEAELVSELALALREDMVGVEGDDAFWKERLFIVSPHHAQIHAIRRVLAHHREWTAPPFVDTVDKMQGQEADAVLVSYGVADPEYAAMEADFIYAYNRLNVAITRARAKSIVFFAKALLDATPEVLDSPSVALGLAYMRGLVQLAHRHGRRRRFDVGEGAVAEVAALPHIAEA